MRLNQRLEKYLFAVQVQMGRSQRVTVTWEGRATISTFIYWAIRLAEFGLLKRVRQCPQCGKWFAAVRRTKRFCSAGCIKLGWQASDVGKEKRRAYMRKYMQKYRGR